MHEQMKWRAKTLQYKEDKLEEAERSKCFLYVEVHFLSFASCFMLMAKTPQPLLYLYLTL
jgi:hypothetical protein